MNDDRGREKTESPVNMERLLAEREATRELLRALARGAGFQSVLDQIVRAAQRLSEGEHAQLFSRDGDVFSVGSEIGLTVRRLSVASL